MRTVAVVLSALALAACAGPSAEPVASTGTNRPSPSVSASVTPAQTHMRFGQVKTYRVIATGLPVLTVAIAAPKPYTPSDYVDVPRGTRAVELTVTVVNVGSEPWDPFEFTASAQSTNVEAERVFDSAKGVADPVTSVLPGREATWRMVFAVADPADVVLEVRPMFGAASTFWT